MAKNLQIRSTAWLILCSLVFSFCYQAQDGCLDPFAVDYDVTADNDCEDCCTNPPLSLTFKLVVDSLNFSKNTAYGYIPGDTIVVTEIEFLLSEFSLSDSVDQSLFIYETEDSLINDDLSIVNDLLFINSSAKSFTPGRFRYVGVVRELDFKIGTPQQINNNTVSFDDSEFVQMQDSLLNENTGIYNQLNFSYFLQDSVIKEIQLIDDPSIEKILSYQLDTLSQKATALSLTLELDLSKLWEGVDFSNDEQLLIEQKFETNFINSFTLE